MIRFNQPYLFGPELENVKEAVLDGRLAGNGDFTKKCQAFFSSRYGFKKCLLTTSCTDALEMCAILLDIKPGDEVIIPSFTFVSSANAFVLRGARIVFADVESDYPNLDVNLIEPLISDKTKAIVVVHYGGAACDMNAVMELAERHDIKVIEDAAQAVDSYYEGRPLGSIGHLSAFSFHETKNVVAGEGGMLVVNDPQYMKRAEIIWEKGTNRAAFFRGEVDKYGWVDVGSSFLPSELVAAYLFGQLENLETIQSRRLDRWNWYREKLQVLQDKGLAELPKVPKYATNNAHVFFLVCKSLKQRSNLIAHLKSHDVSAVFHYISLHNSPFHAKLHDGRDLPNTEKFSNALVRLPLHLHLSESEVNRISDLILEFYEV